MKSPTMSMLKGPERTRISGIFRYIRHDDVVHRLKDGWMLAGTLGPTHSRWSVLMSWCCGDCKDGEAP